MAAARYEIVARLASGGMGEVFRAKLMGEAGFEKVVALKRVFPHLSQNPKYRELFIREAKLTARLSHPNIAQVYELGLDEGRLFIAMEFVDGTDLTSLLQQLHALGAPPELSVLALVARDVLEGLDYAHNFVDDRGKARPVVHRDMSPHNILLATSGIAKICDFGIARGSVEDTARTDILKNRSIGKVAYMPPEQVRGEHTDARTDLYALGVTLWVGATGKGCHSDPDWVSACIQGKELAQPRLRDVWPAAPDDFAAIVDRAVQLDPARRYQTAAEFRDALDQYLAAHGGLRVRDTLRELVLGMRHTVIHRGSVPMTGAPEQAGSRQTVADAPALPAAQAQNQPEQMGSAGTVTVPLGTPPPAETAIVQRPKPPFSARALILVGAPIAIAVVAWLALSRSSAPTAAEALVQPKAADATPTPPEPPSQTPPPGATEARPRPSPAAVTEPARPQRSPGATSTRQPSAAKRRGPVGYLNLEVDPPAAVTVDGQALKRTTPLRGYALPVGRRWITLESADGRTAMIVVEVREGETQSRKVSIK